MRRCNRSDIVYDALEKTTRGESFLVSADDDNLKRVHAESKMKSF